MKYEINWDKVLTTGTPEWQELVRERNEYTKNKMICDEYKKAMGLTEKKRKKKKK